MATAAQLDPDLVRNLVDKAHSDFAGVRSLIERQPLLVNAAWDWGGGDWETGLGAAAHMGRKDIALYLLEKAARIDIFAAAMLGYIEIVRAIVQAVPSAREWLGPHGISLLKHAEAGGTSATSVVAFLQLSERGNTP